MTATQSDQPSIRVWFALLSGSLAMTEGLFQIAGRAVRY